MHCSNWEKCVWAAKDTHGLTMCHNQFQLDWAAKAGSRLPPAAGENLIRNAGRGSQKAFYSSVPRNFCLLLLELKYSLFKQFHWETLQQHCASSPNPSAWHNLLLTADVRRTWRGSSLYELCPASRGAARKSWKTERCWPAHRKLSSILAGGKSKTSERNTNDWRKHTFWMKSILMMNRRSKQSKVETKHFQELADCSVREEEEQHPKNQVWNLSENTRKWPHWEIQQENINNTRKDKHTGL